MRRKIRTVIADDNLDFLDLFRCRLEMDDQIEVVGIAQDGKQTIDLLAQKRIDVLLLDIVMPEIDGLEILHRINKLIHKPLVIVISALGAEDISKQAIAMGALTYLIKPININALITLIKKSCNHDSQISDTVYLRERITELLLSIKMPNTLKGFSYLRDIIIQYIQDVNNTNRVGDLYRIVAAANNTQPEYIQHAISYAIKTAFDINYKVEDGFSDLCIGKFKVKPNNFQFIQSAGRSLLGL